MKDLQLTVKERKDDASDMTMIDITRTLKKPLGRPHHYGSTWTLSEAKLLYDKLKKVLLK